MVPVAHKLRGSLVTLRLLDPELDSAEFFALVDGDRDALGKWLPWVEGHDGVEHSEAFLDTYQLQSEMDNGALWGIEYQGALVGAAILQWVQWEHRSTSLGYWLASASQGKHLAKDACMRLIQHCFEDLGLNRIELSAAVGNTRSLDLARKLGFMQEGVRRQSEYLHGKYLDHALFGLLKADVS